MRNRREALCLASPQIVFDTDANVKAERDRHGADRRHGSHQGLDREHRAIGDAAHEFEHIGRIAAGVASAQRHVIEHQRASVHTRANQPLHGLELVNAADHEMRLDALGNETPEMFDNEGRGRLGDHLLQREGEQRDEVVGGRRPGQALVEQSQPELRVTADDLRQQPLLGPEVVVQEPARNARLARDVVEGRAGGAASRDRGAHGVHDPLGLVAAEGRRGRLHAAGC